MIKLGRIIEQYGAEGQYYDLGKDFANFRRTIDGADEEIKKRYEKSISAKLVGKRVKARASRGYKQYVKDYEFDVTKVTLDDYYDNFVVVAHDNTTPKAKEYFLKPGFKIQILGSATGQPSPQKGGRPEDSQPKQSVSPSQPKQAPDSAQHQPMALAPAGHTPSEEPVKEDNKGYGFHDMYSIDTIIEDIKSWLPDILIKPETSLRDFVKGVGSIKNLGRGTVITMFDLKIPKNMIKRGTSENHVRQLLATKANKVGSTIDTKYSIKRFEENETKDGWNIRILKTITDKSAYE